MKKNICKDKNEKRYNQCTLSKKEKKKILRLILSISRHLRQGLFPNLGSHDILQNQFKFIILYRLNQII